MKTFIERDYKKERENYLGTPEQKKRNAARKRARRVLEKEGKVKPFDGKDVHHKDNNPENNDPKNLKAVDRSWNRTEPRLRKSKTVSELMQTEARAFHDFGASSPAANNKIRDIANKAKDYNDAINKIINHARGTSGASKKFAQAIGAGKFTDWSPDKDIEQEVKDFIKQRDRVKKLGPRANDPDANLFVQIKGAADLRTGSDIKLDDGKKLKLTQKNAKLIVIAMDRVKPQMKKQLLTLLGKNKQSHMRALSAIKRSMS